MPARRAPLCLLLAVALLLAGCAGLDLPFGQPAADADPDTIEVMFLTDPTTGRTEGPFDPDTGLRMMTREDDKGTLRVVLDPVSKQPILLPDPPASPGGSS